MRERRGPTPEPSQEQGREPSKRGLTRRQLFKIGGGTVAAGAAFVAGGALRELVFSGSKPPHKAPHEVEPSTPSPEPTETEPNHSLITVEDGQLVREGKPLGLFGTNCYPLISNGEICGPGVYVTQRKQEMQTAHNLGMNAIRYWDFSTLTDTSTSKQSTEQLLELAETQNILLYPTLINQWSDCEGNTNTPSQNPKWYEEVIADFNNNKNGHDLDPSGYLKYIQNQATEYRGNPNVLAFQLGNELECPDPTILREFAIAGKTIIKDADPTRLVTVGVLGSGQAGASGDDFKQLMKVCDFADIHIYPQSGPPTNGLQGDSWNGVAVRMEQAAELNIPMVVSEFGIPTGTKDLTSYRNTLMKLLTYRNFVGVFPWGLSTPGFFHADSPQDFQFGPDGKVMQMYSQNGLADRLRNPDIRPQK
jgi:endo-1,4-beta-mannosidase